MNACEQFDLRLPDWLEGTLPADQRADADAHLATCAQCRTLVDELTAISRSAAALPPIEPSRDLWAGIAARIEAPVVPLNVTAERAIATRRVFVSRRWLAAAAAALVVASVGATYTVMRVSGSGAPQQVATTSTSQTSAPIASEPAPSSTTIPSNVASTLVTSPVGATARNVARDENVAPNLPGVTTYDSEIRSLRAVLRRRTDLDTATVAVIEKSLRVIDDAIAQSRTALARDPQSRLLGDQLTRALDQKVELLRTAILLPASS